jgi:hypothetical protein
MSSAFILAPSPHRLNVPPLTAITLPFSLVIHRPPWEQLRVANDTIVELLSLVKFLTGTIPLNTLQWRMSRQDLCTPFT